MKSRILSAIGIAALATAGAAAQSAVDTYTLSPVQLRGTARFVGMGGAFTSLGGDISCMTQNPAGLGIYRSSDMGLTFSISPRSYSAETSTRIDKNSETRAYFDNFGYVGVANLSGTLRAIQWGVSYNRLASFDRLSTSYNNPTASSLSNYVASYTNGVTSDALLPAEGYNPYYDPFVDASGNTSYQDWLSVLAYNSFMINNTNDNYSYKGLFQSGTTGDALYEMRERGYIDEYNIDIAGNISDIVYWGLGVGIVDLSYTSESNYSESMANALVYDKASDRLTDGNAGFNLYNNRYVSGSGANIKLGVIVRPLENFRIGLAVHTPTWLHLSHSGYGDVGFNYTPYTTNKTNSSGNDPENTPTYDYASRLNTPWRLMVGASLTVANQAIISLDYERVAYNNMSMKEQTSGGFTGGTFAPNEYANADIKDYYKAANILRVGAEYRINSSFSVRAGYNWQGSAMRNAAMNGGTTIYTSGTDPAYTFYGDTQSISLGAGYRYKAWYIDIAYQHSRQTGNFRAYTPFDDVRDTPSAKITNTLNNIVISTGIRF